MNSLFRPVLRTSSRGLNPSLAARAFSSTPSSALARITIIGRLGAEPELSPTSTGRDVIKYSVGTSFGPKDNRQTSWFRVASFAEGPQRELLLGLAKGTLVYIDADASMRSYTDGEGRKQNSLSILQRNIEILSRPANSSDYSESTPSDDI